MRLSHFRSCPGAYVPELYGTHGGTSGARLVRDQGAGHRLGRLVYAAFLLEIVNGGQRSFRLDLQTG